MLLDTDIISQLIGRGSFHDILIQICIHLDAADIQNLACCCKLWSDFILKYVNRNEVFKKRRLDFHLREKTPSVWIIACGPYVSCIKWDQKIVVIGRGIHRKARSNFVNLKSIFIMF